MTRCIYLIATSALVASSLPISADTLSAALQSGSPRLANFVATEQMKSAPSISSMKAFVSTSAELGFNVTDPDKSIIGFRDSYVSLRPVLSYDPNVNGGNPSDRLQLGDGSFLIFPPETLAVGSGVIGGELSLGAKLFYDRGRYLELGGNWGRNWALEDGFTQTNWSLNLCSRNHVSGWTYFDLCASREASDKSLGSSVENRLEAQISHITDSFGSPAELRLRAFQTGGAGSWLPGSGLDATAVVGPSTSMNFGVEREFGRTGEAWQAFELHGGLTTTVDDRLVGFRVSHGLSVGGMILGQAHQERTTSISLSTAIAKGVNVEVSYSTTQSSLDFYDQGTFGISVSIPGFGKSVR